MESRGEWPHAEVRRPGAFQTTQIELHWTTRSSILRVVTLVAAMPLLTDVRPLSHTSGGLILDSRSGVGSDQHVCAGSRNTTREGSQCEG